MSQRRYDNFELCLQEAGAGLYQVQVSASPQGELPAPVPVPIEVEAAAFPPHGGDLIELGRRLWAWLFPPPVEALYRAALAGLPSGGGLRLRLRLDAPELAALPWELAYDPVRGAFPALSAQTPLVRYLALPYRPSPLAGPSPLRVLFAAASPSDLTRLDSQAEKDLLLAALADLRVEGRVVVDSLPERATVEALQDALRGGYRVLHFSGHGRAGVLLWENEAGLSQPVRAEALAVLLGDSGVGLAVLNACDSGAQPGGPFAGVAPALVRAGLPAVVAMQAPLPDSSAKRFTRNLYAALADGWPLDAAVTEGRKAVMLAVGLHKPDWAMPVLYLRAPDGVLWDFAEEAQPAMSRVDDPGDVYEGITVSGGVVGAIGGRGHRIEQTVASTPPPAPGFDLAVVRDLLLAAFTAPNLRRLFLYTSNAELHPLVQEFGPSDSLSVMADRAIEFCVARDLLPALLEEVQQANPRQYTRYAPQLRGRSSAQPTPSPNLGALRQRLNQTFDDPGLDAFCLDHFPEVYDKFGRGLRKDEKITLLLDHCRHLPARYQRLLAALEELAR